MKEIIINPVPQIMEVKVHDTADTHTNKKVLSFLSPSYLL